MYFLFNVVCALSVPVTVSQLPGKARLQNDLLCVAGPDLLLAGPLFRKKCGGPII